MAEISIARIVYILVIAMTSLGFSRAALAISGQGQAELRENWSVVTLNGSLSNPTVRRSKIWRQKSAAPSLLIVSEEVQKFFLGRATTKELQAYQLQLRVAQQESFRLQGIDHYKILKDALVKDMKTGLYIHSSKIQYQDSRGRSFIVLQYQYDRRSKTLLATLIRQTANPSDLDSVGAKIFQTPIEELLR